MSRSSSDEEDDVVDESGEDESDEESDEDNSDVMSEADEEEFVGRAVDLDVSHRQQSSRACNRPDPGLMALQHVAIQAACARLCEADGPRCKKSLADEEWDVTPEMRQGAMDSLAARKKVVGILERVVNAIVQRDEGGRVPKDALATGRVTLSWLLEKFDAELERDRQARRAQGGGTTRGAGHVTTTTTPDRVQEFLENNSAEVLALRKRMDIDHDRCFKDEGAEVIMPVKTRVRFGLPPAYELLSFESSRCPCCFLLFRDLSSSAEYCRNGFEILLCGHAIHTICRKRWVCALLTARGDGGGASASSSTTDMEDVEFSCPECRKMCTGKQALVLSKIVKADIVRNDSLLRPIMWKYYGPMHFEWELRCLLNPEEKGTEAHYSDLLFRLITFKCRETRRAALYATALLRRCPEVTSSTVALGRGPTSDLKWRTHMYIQKIEHSMRLWLDEQAAAVKKRRVKLAAKEDERQKKRKGDKTASASSNKKKKAKKKNKQTDASTEAGEGNAVGAQ